MIEQKQLSCFFYIIPKSTAVELYTIFIHLFLKKGKKVMKLLKHPLISLC